MFIIDIDLGKNFPKKNGLRRSMDNVKYWTCMVGSNLRTFVECERHSCKPVETTCSRCCMKPTLPMIHHCQYKRTILLIGHIHWIMHYLIVVTFHRVQLVHFQVCKNFIFIYWPLFGTNSKTNYIFRSLGGWNGNVVGSTWRSMLDGRCLYQSIRWSRRIWNVDQKLQSTLQIESSSILIVLSQCMVQHTTSQKRIYQIFGWNPTKWWRLYGNHMASNSMGSWANSTL